MYHYVIPLPTARALYCGRQEERNAASVSVNPLLTAEAFYCGTEREMLPLFLLIFYLLQRLSIVT